MDKYRENNPKKKVCWVFSVKSNFLFLKNIFVINKMKKCKFGHFIVKIKRDNIRFWVFPIERLNVFEYTAIVLNNLPNYKLKSKIKIDLRKVLDSRLI